jgi:glycosyltransferase involved in cell wall biosynthesis
MASDHTYRFLFVSAPFSGIEVYVRNLKEIVAQHKGIDAEWMFVEWNPPELLARVAPLSLNWTLKASYVVRKRLRRLEEQGARFDAVFYNNIVLPTFVSRYHRQIPSVVCLDVTPILLEKYRDLYSKNSGSFARLGNGRIARKLARRVYHGASKIIAWSHLVEESLVADYDVPREHIQVVPPGINLEYWKPQPQNKRNSRIRVLFVGADFERKGGQILLDLARKPQFNQCDFHFVTKSHKGESRENIIFHTDIDPNSDALRQIYYNSDIFVLPTKADFSPNAICEAMGSGLPVVTTRVGAIHEMVKDGVSGYLVDPQDETTFERRLLELVNDPGRRESMGIVGREFALHHYDMQKNAARVLQLMKVAAGAKPERTSVFASPVHSS